VLFFFVYTESLPFRSAASLFAPPSIPTSMRPNSHGIISFADHHPLNSVLSYRYKNMGGRGEAISRSPSPCFPLPLSLLVATLMGPLVSVANKRLIEMLKPLNATLTKNRGGGLLWLTSPQARSVLNVSTLRRANVRTCPSHTHCRAALLFLRSGSRGISMNHV
jgi:hypothetical protein